jgi:hypothetical protein
MYLMGTPGPDGKLSIGPKNPSYAIARAHKRTNTWLNTEAALHSLWSAVPAPQVAMTSECTRARLVTATILRPSAQVACNQILSSDKEF